MNIMIQTIITILIGIVAVIYVVKIFTKQFLQVETNPKCQNCPVPEILESSTKGK